MRDFANYFPKRALIASRNIDLRRFELLRYLIVAIAGFAFVAVAVASARFAHNMVDELTPSQENTQYFIYQARVEHLKLIETLLHANVDGKYTDEIGVWFEIFAGRILSLRSLPVMQTLRQRERISEIIAEAEEVIRDADANRNTLQQPGFIARLDSLRPKLQEAAQIALAHAAQTQQARFDAILEQALIVVLTVCALFLAITALFWVTLFQNRQLRSSTLELARVSERLETILSAAPDAIITIGCSQRIISANEAAHAVFGYPPGSMVGLKLDALVSDEFRASHATVVDRHLKTGGRLPYQMAASRFVDGLRADGTSLKVHVTIAVSEFGEEPLAIVIARDVTDVETKNFQLTRLSQELGIRLQELEVASSAKSRFIASMSHELRTPLNAIIGFADLLTSGVARSIAPAKRDEYLSDIKNAGGHLLALINDILDLSRLEAGTSNLRPDTEEVRSIISEALRTIRPLARTRFISIRARLSPHNFDCVCDRRAMLQVLLNLLSNAVKFAKRIGGRILVAAVRAPDGTTRISVRDNGIGIPPDKVGMLARPFVQVGDVYTSETKGTGLGLAISRRLVEQMSGTLTIESEFGHWTEVTVMLPGPCQRL